jgi:hypothetical protein
MRICPARLGLLCTHLAACGAPPRPSLAFMGADQCLNISYPDSSAPILPRKVRLEGGAQSGAAERLDLTRADSVHATFFSHQGAWRATGDSILIEWTGGSESIWLMLYSTKGLVQGTAGWIGDVIGPQHRWEWRATATPGQCA